MPDTAALATWAADNPRAAWRALDCADARDSLAVFCGMIEIPGAPIGEEPDEATDAQFLPVETPPAAHHKLLIEKLEAVERGEIRRLMVFMPPGSSKSTYASVIFPVWFMGRAKRRNVIIATYASDLARKLGRRARSILKQPVYREIFKTGLSGDSSAADEWALENENEFMGGGILSGITGNRADCLRADTIILTEQGGRRIEDLVDEAFSGSVLSYDSDEKRVVARPVKAVARRVSPDFYRVRSISGRVAELTGDHRVYTARGYVPARLLACGDVLLRVVRKGDPATRLQDQEGGEAWPLSPLLRARLSPIGSECQARDRSAEVPRLRDRHIAESQQSQEGGQILHSGVRRQGHSHEVVGLHIEGAGAPMRAVRPYLPAQDKQDSGPVLLADVQGPRPRGGYDREGESRLAEWGEPPEGTAAFGTRLSQGQAEDFGARRVPLRGLRDGGQTARPPHRHECLEQSLGQSGDALRDLPHDLAWGRAFDTQADAVAMVERICEPTEVFDIEVEGTHCFFADGLLVHNCIIIDDPIRGRQDADSETIRVRTRSEYDDSIKTRLKPGGRIVLIQTRWHEDDLAGGLLPHDYDGESGQIRCRDGQIWEVLCLPAEAMQDDPLGRKPGEMLWPEWFDSEHWQSYRNSGRTWSALYQQRPQPAQGTYFIRQWFDGGEVDGRTFKCNRYRPEDLPKALHKYGTSDYAVTEDGGDFTVHRVWGVDPDGELWLLPGGYRAQATTDVWIDAVIDQMAMHRPAAWFGEAGVILKAVEPALLRRMKERQVMCRLEWLSSITDKATRARGFQARAAMGTVHLPFGPEGDAILDEYVRFPAGRNDDDVDVGSMIGRALDMTHPAIAPIVKKPPEMRGISNMTMDEAMQRHDRMTGGYQRIA